MKQKLDIKWYNSIDSTNLQAVRESDDAPDRRVWAAEFQTAGRGQRGNKWEGAKNKNLAFTILLRPFMLSPSKQFLISEVSAIGVCNYLKGKGVDATIKWPNDIYVGDKKICGMLIEHSLSGEGISYSISGIGINMNQRIFNSDAPNPTSLSLLRYPDILSLSASTEEEPLLFNLKVELEEVLHCLFDLYDRLSDKAQWSIIEREYLNLMYRREGYYFFKELSLKGAAEPVTVGFYKESCDEFKHESNIIEARIVGLDTNYNLILEQRNGTVHSYAFKEIKYLL